jgi:hypothetical protein
MKKIMSQVILTNLDNSSVQGLIGLSGSSKQRRLTIREHKRQGRIVLTYSKCQRDQVADQLPFGPFTPIEG